MATDGAMQYPDRPPMTVAEIVALTKKELNPEDERHVKVAATGIGALEGQTLDLSHQGISVLPVEVIVLIKDKVERLALSHNPQIAVPTEIVQCDRLRYLNIRWNQLKSFPDAVLQLTSLEILDLSKNRIVSIPEGIKKMTSLKFLAIARNKITRLPLALGDMPSLTKLKFDENPIEYPPAEVLRPQSDRTPLTIESGEKDICQQVKRWLKAASTREKLRTTSEESLSESNAETPRPLPRRTATIGRFPVRPSLSNIDTDDLQTRSPKDAPPIPPRSHARNSSISGNGTRRPGIAPLLTNGNDSSRSRSETVSSSASLRSRRQGFVPRKSTLDQNTLTSQSSQSSIHSATSTIRPMHSRGGSSVSTLNGFLAAGSGGETSSGAVSPIDGPSGRSAPVHRLSSLPENRNSSVQTSAAVKASKRLVFCLFQLHGPVSEVARSISDGSPKRSMLERLQFTAHAQVEELDRLLANIDDLAKGDQAAVKTVALACITALQTYSKVFREIRQYVQRVVAATDAIYVRCLMHQIYSTMIESRNICSLLGFKLKSPASKGTPRASRVWSSRTVTPTQPKPIQNKRLRGASILSRMASNGSMRAAPPPNIPMNGTINSSRTNTMTSIGSVATPRSSESFSSLASSAMSSRTNTMRSIVSDDLYGDEHFDRIFVKLRSACDLAAQSLPQCRAEFADRRDNAEGASHSRAVHHWSLALIKCEAVMAANKRLLGRMSVVKLKDPGIRHQRDFWQLCDVFVKSWTDLATEIKDLVQQQRIDITTLRSVMRPVQKAVKEVSKAISDSPLYHQAVRPSTSGQQTPNSISGSHHHMPFPANLNTSFGGFGSGYVTPVPQTPLSAALGPAVQATVASTPGVIAGGQPEYFPQTMMRSREYERYDTVVPRERRGENR